ncbi:hypothetical protein Leryth_013326, partial [Lithospermum erythrorhizon]
MREDCSDKNIDGFRSVRGFNWGMTNNIDHKRETSESVVDNVVDLLPKDPFNFRSINWEMRPMLITKVRKVRVLLIMSWIC